jgi:iron complex transport system substrate-binding protein
MKVNKETIASREKWSTVSAVRNGHIYEIESSHILQPGPASLTVGLQKIHSILARVAG